MHNKLHKVNDLIIRCITSYNKVNDLIKTFLLISLCKRDDIVPYDFSLAGHQQALTIPFRITSKSSSTNLWPFEWTYAEVFLWHGILSLAFSLMALRSMTLIVHGLPDKTKQMEKMRICKCIQKCSCWLWCFLLTMPVKFFSACSVVY